MAPGARSVYDEPLLYDIAFSYRDFPAEVDALVAWYARVSGAGRPPASFLELAAGPADHAIEMALRGAAVTALDRAPAMCSYAAQKADLLGAPIEVACADMIDFALPRRFELAALMINSIAHLHELDDLVRHLRAVARHLEAGGVYVLEAQHPADFVGRGARPAGALQPWTVERYGLEVRTRWGTQDDPYDPIRQIFEARVELRVRGPEGEEILRETVPMRDWTRTEIEAAIRMSGAFELAEIHGALAADAPFDRSPESWRMVLVLRRR